MRFRGKTTARERPHASPARRGSGTGGSRQAGRATPPSAGAAVAANVLTPHDVVVAEPDGRVGPWIVPRGAGDVVLEARRVGGRAVRLERRDRAAADVVGGGGYALAGPADSRL